MRLVLRRFADADAASFAAYRDDPDVALYQDWDGCSLAEAVQFIQHQGVQPLGEPGHWCQIAVALRRTDALIGDCGLLVHADDPCQATVGVTFARTYQGQGYATEALTSLFDDLFRRAQFHRVAANVDPRNRASWRLLERLGMRREGHRVQSARFKGQWADEYLYAILREGWLTRRANLLT